MVNVIYGDVLFLVNFSMDFLCLFVTGRLFHLRMRAARLAGAAAFGAIYAVAEVFWQTGGGLLLATQIGVALAMVTLAFGVRRCLLYTGVFWLCGAGLGGLMTGIFHVLQGVTGRILMEGNVVDLYGDVPAGAILALGGLSAAAVAVGGRAVNRGLRSGEAAVRAVMGEREVCLRCLRDSGNLLSEPYTGYPVIVIRREDMRKLVPAELAGVFGRNRPESLAEIDGNLARRVKIIPVQTAERSGIMMGIVPDRLWVDGAEKIACLAAARADGDFGGFDGIVPAVLC